MRDTRVREVRDQPVIEFVDGDGVARVVRCDYLVGADGSHSICRHEIPESLIAQYFKEYPFAWFGIITEAPMSARTGLRPS